uniref:7TM_GPCR_Srx domain-containing protein n=1 Tax=Heterorhabditis bacteriophora TaxID=37862 RepID=A0A1I7WIU9_HETBA
MATWTNWTSKPGYIHIFVLQLSFLTNFYFQKLKALNDSFGTSSTKKMLTMLSLNQKWIYLFYSTCDYADHLQSLKIFFIKFNHLELGVKCHKVVSMIRSKGLHITMAMDLIFAFIVGIPCHVLLFWAIIKERKTFFSPFLIFYSTNFLLNVIFTIVTIIAVSMDIHKQLFGNIKYDLGWTAFQILFTSAQGLAIYIVMRCRKYVAAKEYWKARNVESTVIGRRSEEITNVLWLLEQMCLILITNDSLNISDRTPRRLTDIEFN